MLLFRGHRWNWFAPEARKESHIVGDGFVADVSQSPLNLAFAWLKKFMPPAPAAKP